MSDVNISVDTSPVTIVVSGAQGIPGEDGSSSVTTLTTTGLTPANMLRIAAGGGLEERTPAQVRGDIGATTLGTPDTIVLRNAQGGASFLATTAEAINAAATSGIGVYANSTSGYAIYGISSSGTAIYADSAGGDQANFGNGKFVIDNNGNTAITGTIAASNLSIAVGQVFTSSNTLTLAGTNGSTLNVGAGGTLGTAAYIAATSKQDAIAFGTGVQIALGASIGSAGAPVLFGGAAGTPTAITLTNATGTAAGLTAGNVTTNANLTGVVTSAGNATAIADAALSIAKTSGLQTGLDAKAAARIRLTGTQTYQAVDGGRYITHGSGAITFTDPVAPSNGGWFDVLIGGTTTAVIGGVTMQASRFSQERIYSAGAWMTSIARISDTLTVGASAATWDGATISGAQTFSSVTRPSTASVTGLPAAGDLMNRSDVTDERGNPRSMVLMDEFTGGSNASTTIGALGWYIYAVGGGTGAAIGVGSTGLPNIGTRTLTCGNATNAGYTMYLPSFSNIISGGGDWEATAVVKLTQTTDCDMIFGFTRDTGAVGIGNYGGISFGARYSSAVDTNFMFYSKNANTTWAANDANNNSISSGVAVNTSFNTFRIRSVSGAISMSVNGGAYTTVGMSGIANGSVLPFFYVSTRTTTSKSIEADYFSLIQKATAR